MKDKVLISGFADEIDSDFITQMETVTGLGMQYISLRSAYGKGIAAYTPEETKEKILPVLKRFGVKVSSLGSPIGKIGVEDEDGFERQQKELDVLCRISRLLDCRYIRIFSFYMPKGMDPEEYRDTVIRKLKIFLETAKRHGVILIHENEKDIFGDSGGRCRELMDAVSDPCFRSAFDFANFVQCGEDTRECWNLLRNTISYIHIKDAVSADNENVLCGTGEGHIMELLDRGIHEDGYEGFLTLEPHLVIFDSLASLEMTGAESIIKKNKAESGADAYKMQYHALCGILNAIHMQKK